jgi:hypothetical protein
MQENQFSQDAIQERVPAASGSAPCEECVGSGGWFRYEPALEPAPGLLYLSCLQCRGSGRSAAGARG